MIVDRGLMMREVFVARLQELGLPAWLVPDYWFMLTLAIISGSLITLRLCRQSGFGVRRASDLLFWGILMLLVGSRIFYFLQYGFPLTLKAWMSSGGMSLYGGLAGLLAAWVVLFRLKTFPFLQFLDCVTPALALGLFLGRLGCFLAGCNGGKICALPWSVRFPNGTPTFFRQQEVNLIDASETFSLPVHPTQLYESFFGLVTFFLLLALLRKKQADGQVFLTGILWYAVFRFATETLRADAGGIHPFGILTFAQLISILLGAGAALGLIRLWRQTRNYSP